MNTNKTGSITKILEKRLPVAEKIAGVEAELQSLDSVLRQLQKHRNQLLKRVDDPNVARILGEIDFATLQLSINTELEALVKLKERFCHKTLNIGVVGQAKQGKSRLLQNLTGLAQDIANKDINIVECVTANCANTQEANKVLERVVDYLKEKMTDLDYKYALLCQQELTLLQNQVNPELEKVSKALDLATHDDVHRFALFEIKFQELWSDVTNSLEKLLLEQKKKREAVDIDFKKQLEVTLQTCRSDTGIPSIQEIEQRFCLEKSYALVYEKYLNEIRAHLSKHLLLLDSGLQRSLDKVKSQVAQVLIEKGHLGRLTETKGTEFIEAIAVQIPDELIPGIPSQLKYGFQTLAQFDLTYRGLLQHRIRKHLNGLTPNEPATLKVSASPSAEQVLLNLKIAYAETVSKCEKALKELLCEPSQAIYAIVEEFIDCILRARDVESEWRIFLQDVRGQIWQEFQQLGDDAEPSALTGDWAKPSAASSERTQLRREVLDSVEQATAANQSELMHFLK
ncbi:hypothetical protein [Mastigocladopsis repens]|uniref:hypothetical protein n=1 Tax=Mastigocladopsis repens TaxID=221287 RepID=UPI0002EB586C|nr:hypothetical protein [Mastigocladopsis repens]